MISIKREGKDVFILFETDLPYYDEDETETICRFRYPTSSIQEAELLYRYLNKRLEDRIANIREKEFSSGWKHAKAKKYGRRWFGWFSRQLGEGASCE